MAKPSQFKLYLHIRGKQEEVRRFTCDGDIDIRRLHFYIKESFPHLSDKAFVIKWEDEEGDKVDISTQQELMLAMQEMKMMGSVYKLHIFLLENPWWKQKSPEKTYLNSVGDEHPGIFCCCCHQQVNGFRYKCVICPNYDICGSCEEMAMHPAHDMVRIPSPRPYPPYFFMRLQRLYERNSHSSPTLIKPGCGAMSSINEQMARDLLEDDTLDISDLELEVSLVPEGSKSAGSVFLPRKRNNSDPGFGSCPNVVEQIAPLGSDTKKYSMMQEKLPSFEELAKNMQDLAEKDLDDFTVQFGTLENLSISSSANNRMKSTEDFIISERYKHQGTYFSNNQSFSKEKEKKNIESVTDNNDIKFSSRRLKESSRGMNKNNNQEEIIDTSESFRNIQQEIENLLAPLAPLSDFESVPKAVKTSDNQELFVLMNNRVDNQTCNTKSLDNGHIRTGSFEIVENNMKEVCEPKQLDGWSLLVDKQLNDYPVERRENGMKEVTGNGSSETDIEDHIESDDESNVNISYTDEAKLKGNQWKVIEDNSYTENIIRKQTKWEVKLEKEIKDMENSTIASNRYINKGKNKEETKYELEDSLKDIENAFKITGKMADSGGSVEFREGLATLPRCYSVTDPMSNSSTSGHNLERNDRDWKETQSSERPSHYNPKVADALNTMVGMGFTDDDGWLTQLLVINHGDISQVLDILTQVKQELEEDVVPKYENFVSSRYRVPNDA